MQNERSLEHPVLVGHSVFAHTQRSGSRFLCIRAVLGAHVPCSRSIDAHISNLPGQMRTVPIASNTASSRVMYPPHTPRADKTAPATFQPTYCIDRSDSRYLGWVVFTYARTPENEWSFTRLPFTRVTRQNATPFHSLPLLGRPRSLSFRNSHGEPALSVDCALPVHIGSE